MLYCGGGRREEGELHCHKYIEATLHIYIHDAITLRGYNHNHIMLINRANRATDEARVTNNSLQTLTDGLRRCKNISFVVQTLDTPLNPI